MYIADPLDIKTGFSKIKPPSPPSDTMAPMEEEKDE
jgi:hypothetical protein